MDLIGASAQFKLEVIEIPETQAEWSVVRTVAGAWVKSAREKMCESGQKDMDYDQFAAVINIASIISDVITSRFFCTNGEGKPDPDLGTIFICYSGDRGNIEGMALFVKEVGYLKVLVSNPKNIKHPLNDQARRIHGAGTAIIRCLAGKCVEIGMPLKLTSNREAFPFYERLGFRPVLLIESQFLPMFLSLEKCKAIS